MTSFRSRLAESIRASGLTVNALCDRSGVDHGTIRRIKAGGSVTVRLLVKLLREMPEVDAHWLLMGDGFPPPDRSRELAILREAKRFADFVKESSDAK